MPQIRKLVKANLQSAFSISHKSPKGSRPTDSGSELDVSEEYRAAFRRKSYEEVVNRVRQENVRIDEKARETLSSSSITLSDVHLADHLSEPQGDEALIREATQSHHLIGDYFEATLEACGLCDLLLRCIQQTRTDRRKFERVLKLGKMVLESGDNSADAWEAIFRELAKCAALRNPLSSLDAVRFRDLHSGNLDLLDRLTTEQKRIRRRMKFYRICKRVGLGGYCFVVVTHAALVSTALLVLALHGLVGILAAPGLVACCFFYLFRKSRKLVGGGHLLVEKGSLNRIHRQLEVASKGTYILINDFDTFGVTVRRLYDEVEHGKALANLCIKSRSADLFKEVVNEFYLHNSCYLEQLEELERHAYLCFKTIDGSRKIVIEEIIKAAG